MTKQELLDKIESFKNLKKNWDTYDADPIPIETIEFAKNMVNSLDESLDWFVAPCDDGAILFEAGNYSVTIFFGGVA